MKSRKRVKRDLHFVITKWQTGSGGYLPNFDESILRRAGQVGISQRAIHALVDANVTSMTQLRTLSYHRLLAIKNCGKITAQELRLFREQAE
jgi:hypothetical protein